MLYCDPSTQMAVKYMTVMKQKETKNNKIRTDGASHLKF